jgi:hypothetical protein
VLRLVRSIKNSLAPINRLPPEVPSPIPNYYDEDDEDNRDGAVEVLIALTHACRAWRETFISCPWLWTRFYPKNVDRAHTYIQCSQSSPFKIDFWSDEEITNAFPLTIHMRALPDVVEHFRCHTPLLEKLDIRSRGTLDSAFFNGDLSSLRQLHLHRIFTYFPWGKFTDLQVIDLDTPRRYETTQLLDFLESAPLLHTVPPAFRCQIHPTLRLSG